MEGSEHEKYIHEAEENGYRKMNPLVDVAWHVYQLATDFDSPNSYDVQRIGEILQKPGDKELDDIFDKLGFKDIGKAFVDAAKEMRKK